MKNSGSSAFSAITRLFRIFSKKQKKEFRWLVFLTFISSITDILGLASVIPLVGLVLNKDFHDVLTGYLPFLAPLSKEQLLLSSVGLFFILIVGKNIWGYYVNRLQVAFVKRLFVSSTSNVLDKIYERSLLDIQQKTSSEWVNKITHKQIALCSNATISTIIIINEAIVFGLTIIIVSFWSWQLFLLFLCVLIPAIGFFYSKVKTLIRQAGQEKNRNFTYLNASAQEMIFGYTDIKIAGTEQSFKKRFENIARKFSTFQGRVDFVFFIPGKIIEVATFVCIIVILMYGLFILKDTHKIIATITLFSVIAYRSIPSVNRFVMAMNNLNATEFIFEDEDFLQSEKEGGRAPLQSISLSERIAFENVSYTYPGEGAMVLNNIDIEIKKGEKVGIIGKSGSGKSTLVANLLGFLRPTAGRIMVDDQLLNDSNTRSWWQMIGYVRQDVFIMNRTFIENIAIGIPVDQLDMDRVNKAIELASLSGLVAELPEGLYTPLNERGSNLSGGQKQRIAIARAIYKGAEVLIFDEATSALDSKTEEEITNAIGELGKEDLTIIIIAHRYTSLKYCDKIYALESGSVADLISYGELTIRNAASA
jgi:ABC-type multidrug transport system fused ATPase/permease subunit